jgi:tetratricopeptide (TPR) repeat protein
VRVERLGAMRMPVTVAARFEDGSEQRSQTERLADMDEVRFEGNSALKSVVIEPDAAVALAEDPKRELKLKVEQMPWMEAGDAALDAYRKACELNIEDADVWAKLGMILYDGHHYPEALAAMGRLSQGNSDLRFMGLVWQGHLLDLLGRRAEALASYQEALKVPGEPRMQHSQYNLVINKRWVEERLKTPFERK